MNPRGCIKNVKIKEKGLEKSYIINSIVWYYLNTNLDWSYDEKYQEMSIFDQISLLNDPMNHLWPPSGWTEILKIDEKGW